MRPMAFKFSFRLRFNKSRFDGSERPFDLDHGGGVSIYIYILYRLKN